jgi:hypothetical protein
MVKGLLIGAMALFGCGSSTQPARPVANVAPCTVRESPGEAITREALTAVAAGNSEAVAKLAPPRSVVEQLLAQCDAVVAIEAETITRSFIEVTTKAKGIKLEVLAVRDAWDASARGDRNTSSLAALGRACAGKLDVKTHAVEAKIRATLGDTKPHESTIRVNLMTFEGRTYVTGLPRIRAGSGATEALAMMRGFSNRMCQCADKACADQVQDDMVKWGTEAAKAADRDERPDPEMVRESGEIMTRYTECMTKLMMSAPTTP